MTNLREVCLIDHGLTTIESITITAHLLSLNLHSNRIIRINSLDSAINLQHLDLSSNSIKQIEGIDSLKNLTDLNLSCNKIQSVTGLHNLRNLNKLDLSHNAISDISGLRGIPSTKFHILFLHGNNLEDLDHVLACLEACRNLKQITFKQNDAVNPICNEKDYAFSIWNILPQLISLDTYKKDGSKLQHTVSISPYLNEFSEFLSSSSEISVTENRLSTPKIDAVLNKFHKSKSETHELKASSYEDSSISESNQTTESLKLNKVEKVHLKVIEEKLTELLEKASSETKKKQISNASIATQTDFTNKKQQKSTTSMDSKACARLNREKKEEEKRQKLDLDRLHQAESASHKLANMVRQLQQTLSEERDKRIECESIIESLKREINESAQYVGDLNKKCQTAEMELADAERNNNKKINELKEEMKQLRKECFGYAQKSENLKAINISLKSKLKTKETDYEKEINDLKTKIQDDTKQRLKVDMLAQEFSILEGELRSALLMEAETRNTIAKELNQIKIEFSDAKIALKESNDQNTKSGKIINELTQMIREQKGRLTELSKCKNEQNYNYKDRIVELEKHIDEAKKRMIQLELVKKERNDLISQLTAVKSVNEGLKAERKIWSSELAEQGASLAQERGRLESKIEALKSENSVLTKQLDSEIDSIRIKNAVIQDQTSTISKLKDAVLERDSDLKEARNESLRLERELQDHLENDTCLQKDYDERLDRLKKRKDDLKNRVIDLEEEVENWRRSHGAIKSQWTEKCDLIVKLEEKVRKLKTVWDEKEDKLQKERDEAVKIAEDCRKNLMNADDAFRQQLIAQKEGFDRKLKKLLDDKEKEISTWKTRVDEVENEMRELLKENEATKLATEAKLLKLQTALANIQSAF